MQLRGFQRRLIADQHGINVGELINFVVITSGAAQNSMFLASVALPLLAEQHVVEPIPGAEATKLLAEQHAGRDRRKGRDCYRSTLGALSFVNMATSHREAWSRDY